MKLGFLLTNPRHHAELMQPVAAELRRRGHQTTMVSLAELRGFVTPPGELVAAIPWQVRKSPQAGAEFGIDGAGAKGALRKLAQALALTPLLPRLGWLLRGAAAVAVPNDAAYPYHELTRALAAWRKPVALLQEGIRFPLPNERTSARVYGGSGVAAVCAWGEGAAEHFRRVAAPTTTVHVTGNPRFDELDVAAWRARGRELLQRLRLGAGPLLYLSNPIDDQGFCSTAEKMKLFELFVERAAQELVRRAVPLVVKLHPREDAEAYRALAARAAIPVHVAGDEPLFAWLAVARGAVVLASTVGLEALRFGVPLGVLPLPGHGYVFEYASHGAAVALAPESSESSEAIEAGLGELFDGGPARSAAAAALLTRHLGAGDAAARIADVLEKLGTRGGS